MMIDTLQHFFSEPLQVVSRLPRWEFFVLLLPAVLAVSFGGAVGLVSARSALKRWLRAKRRNRYTRHMS